MKKNIILGFLAFAVASVLPSVSFAQQRSDWMSKISDDTYVCSMSIPGTHDSCTYGVSGKIVCHYARCQDFNLEEQEITHGPITCDITFVDAMKTIINLIKKHSSEFAIIMVNQESSSNKDYNEIDLAATQCTEWLLSQENPGMFVEFRPDLKLGEVRGKILIINRDDFNGSYKNGHTFPLPGFWHRLGIVMEDFAGKDVDIDTGETFEECVIVLNPFEQQ